MISCYGLIVEGSYDETVFPELVRKIITPEVQVLVRPCGGIAKLVTRFPGYLAELEHAWNGGPVDKAFVIRDWNGPDFASKEKQMAQKVVGRQFSFPHGVQFRAVRQEMETWLLVDGDAINVVEEQRGGRHVSQIQEQPEELSDPKERLMSASPRQSSL